MNRKTREAKATQRAGSLTEALGKLLGSSELQQAGRQQANAGKTQEARGRHEEAGARKRHRAPKE